MELLIFYLDFFRDLLIKKQLYKLKIPDTLLFVVFINQSCLSDFSFLNYKSGLLSHYQVLIYKIYILL